MVTSSQIKLELSLCSYHHLPCSCSTNNQNPRSFWGVCRNHFSVYAQAQRRNSPNRTKMPGPGPHMMYTLGSGIGLMSVSNGRFSPHHCLTYSINAFFGPDIGSFSEWLTSTLGLGSSLGYAIEPWIHDPLFYILILGIPMSMLYTAASKFLLKKGFLDSVSGVPLTRKQCLFLVAAGSLSHFFLDHLFEENGKSTMYTWVLSTGWWEGRAPINPDAVVVVCILCICLIADFIYINRVKPLKLLKLRVINSVKLILVIASIYCLWCATQIYLVHPRRPAVGEEADLGVIVFMGIFFFLPHWLCIQSMNSRDPEELLPL